MQILEIVAETSLGEEVFASQSTLKSGLRAIEKRTSSRTKSQTTAEERQRVADIVELCFEFKREDDPEERKNILRTLDEIVQNDPFELPRQTIEQWDNELATRDQEYAKLRKREGKSIQAFLKRYFVFKANAGLKTQADVARAAHLGRTQITVIESGAHMPQQKTLQKLAKAFGVEVTDLMEI